MNGSISLCSDSADCTEPPTGPGYSYNSTIYFQTQVGSTQAGG
jgi:hypothetical protein